MSFKDFLVTFQSNWRVLVAATLVAVSLLKFSNILPPWPDEAGYGATACSAGCVIVGLALGYYFKFSTMRFQRKAGVILLGLVPIAIIFYALLNSQLVEVVPQIVDNVEIHRKVIVGTETRNPADKALSPRKLIELYGISGEAWTRSSLTFSRLLLLTSYCLIFFLLTLGLGLLQRTT